MTTNQTQAKPNEGGVITRLLLASGVAGPLLFTIVYLIEGATRPGYDAWRQAVSALSLSTEGWMQIASFIFSGALILGFGIGVRQTLDGGRGGKWGPALIAAVGVGLIAAGVFVTDPALGYPPGTPPGPAVHTTLHGILHWVMGGLVVFSCLPASCLVLAWRWAADAEWKGWATYSFLTGMLMMVFFVAFLIASIRDGAAGVFERISLSLGMSWIALLATRLLWMRAQGAFSLNGK